MKVSKCVTLASVLLAVYLQCDVLEGAAMWTRDPCPPGINPGEDWFPEEFGCGMCSCNSPDHQPGYACYTCGVAVGMISRSECYLDKSNLDDRYPGCCRVQEFCPGDDRYNASRAGINYIG